MEQQDQIQSVTETSIEDPKELQWNEEVCPFVFEDGMYSVKGVEGKFMSIDTLKKAWRFAVSQKKLKEAATMMRASVRPGKTEHKKAEMRNKAVEEKLKWQNP